MASPLRREGRVIGTLAVYDKVAPDSFYPTTFNDDDFQIFAKLVSYVERAVSAAAFYAEARRHRSFDEETGLPNAGYLAKRVDEEIARSAGREGAFAVAVCRIDNFSAIVKTGDAGHARRVVQRTADALRAHVRGFDVPARTGDAEFTVLLPDLGSATEAISALARSVAEEVAKDDAVNEPERIALAFGYAVVPADGSERDALFAAAAVPRINTV